MLSKSIAFVCRACSLLLYAFKNQVHNVQKFYLWYIDFLNDILIAVAERNGDVTIFTMFSQRMADTHSNKKNTRHSVNGGITSIELIRTQMNGANASYTPPVFPLGKMP